MDLYAKFEDERRSNAAGRVLTRQSLLSQEKLFCYHNNDTSTHTKNNRWLRLTIMDLHTKAEDDRRSNAASRALKRQSLLFPQKLLLPWQLCLRPYQPH